MPFTPLHLGPGLLAKSLAGRHFSLIGFAVSQVVIDIEPLLRILRGDTVLHGWTHSYAGALLIGAALWPLLASAWPLLVRMLRRLAARERIALPLPLRPPWRALGIGVLFGTISHVALDTVMHADLRPLWPWSSLQPGHALIGIDALHALCVLTGALGALLLTVRGRRGRSRS